MFAVGILAFLPSSFFPCFTLCRWRAVGRRVVLVNAREDKGTNKGAKGGTMENRTKQKNDQANEQMNKGTKEQMDKRTNKATKAEREETQLTPWLAWLWGP